MKIIVILGENFGKTSNIARDGYCTCLILKFFTRLLRTGFDAYNYQGHLMTVRSAVRCILGALLAI